MLMQYAAVDRGCVVSALQSAGDVRQSLLLHWQEGQQVALLL